MATRKTAGFMERLTTLEPAMIRGFIVTVFGLVAAIFGTQIDSQTVDLVITFVLALLGLITALFIRPSVTANKKVLAYIRDPLERPIDIEPGLASVPEGQADEVVRAAVRKAA
jgi:hypothetical protein